MKKKTKNDELVEELISVFLEIDKKIILLHKDSSDVFLKLNRYLKEYHKKYGIISGNVNRIFDPIVGNDGKSLLEEYNLIYDELNEYKIIAEQESNKNYELLKKFKTDINYLLVVIRNFRQDLTTFKFLTTNYRLLSKNNNFHNSSFESINEWENTAIRIRKGISEINLDFDQISTSANVLLTDLKRFTGDTLSNIHIFYQDLKTTRQLINRKEQESKEYFPVLKEKMKNSRKNIENIITHLQYHDIIRQKIEHIQISHQKIVFELQNDNKKLKEQDLHDDDERFSLISEISGLQAAQLILISKEYQRALEVITQNFHKIAGDLASVTAISNQFSYEEDNSDMTLINRIRNRMDKGMIMMDKFNFSSFNNEISLLLKNFKKTYQKAGEKIFTPLEDFNKLAFSLDNIENEPASGSVTPGIVFHMTALAKDILRKKDELQSDMEEIEKLAITFQQEHKKDEFGSHLEKEQIRIMVSITKILSRLDNESIRLDDLLSQNYKLSNVIIEKLKETIDDGDYYELFDNVLSEIIEKLNVINTWLSDGNGDKKSFDKIESLKEIEAMYTVASERYIHKKVIDGEEEGVFDLSDENKDEQSDDVELF